MLHNNHVVDFRFERFVTFKTDQLYSALEVDLFHEYMDEDLANDRIEYMEGGFATGFAEVGPNDYWLDDLDGDDELPF